MKKSLFLTCCVLLTFGIIGYSQTYPIPAPGSQWGELTFLGPPCVPGAGNYGSVYRYNGRDTIIDEQIYQYWGSGTFTRYDDNKLYLIDKYRSKPDSIVEFIYYDFNLEVGDRFLLPITYDTVYAIVEEVSNFSTLNGQTRKKIFLRAYDNDSNLLVQLEWIEGIGAVNNILFYENQLMYNGTTDIYTHVVCFSDSSGYVYKDERFDYSCDEIESIKPFIVDAGRDTTFCYCECNDTTRLGGNPSAFQVFEPKYTWTTINSHPASYFLNDTTAANPILNNEKLMIAGESVTFVLTVTENYCENQKSDSVTVRAVSIGQTLVYYNPQINKGDSVTLPHNEFLGGIEPLKYYWSPNYNISATDISNPKAWPDTSTTYNVYVIDSIGCKSPIDVIDVTVKITDAISLIELSKGESTVFPNPVTANSVLIFEPEVQSDKILKIINTNGTVVYNGLLSENPFKIGNLIQQNGMYFYSIWDKSEVLTRGKFVKNL